MCKHTVCPAGAAHTEHFEPVIPKTTAAFLEIGPKSCHGSMLLISQKAEIPSSFCTLWSCSFSRLCGEKQKNFVKIC